MCGIAGLQGRFAPDLLASMNDSLAHRGPDGEGAAAFDETEGVWTGLAHRRLAIIDLTMDGRQPMAVACRRCGADGLGDLALTYNGEIYNFPELRRQLEARGHRFHSRTDSEVLLHLYAEEGHGMLARLNGIFAFALRDGRSTGRPEGVDRGDLLMARDGLGVKPLYYSELPDGLLFASEMKALVQCPALPRDIDPLALHQQLAYLWTPAPRTLLRSVRKLRPGHALHVRQGRVHREWRYYDLPYGRGWHSGGEAEIASELREALRAAVERQLVADVEVGAFLSGGLDSSAVVAMMRRARPGARIACYSIGFDDGVDLDGSPQDLPYARRVAAHLGVDLREIRVRPDIVDRLEEMLWFLDEPQADVAPLNALLICRQARQDGIPVLLSGAGGDDVFSGYRRHVALRADAALARLPRSVRALLAAAARRAPAPSSGLRRVRKFLEHADESGDRRIVSHFLWSGDASRRALYSADLAGELAGADAADPLLESLARIPSVHDPLERMLYLEKTHFLADHNLNYTDKMGMAAGVEVRVPFLDLELLELALRIPPGLKQRGREGKSILKRAMAGDLPADVIHRPKTGFGAPVRRWIRRELRAMVDETLSPESLRRRGLFDHDAVQRLIAYDRAGQVDGAYTILALMCVEIWCRLFVDAPVRAVPWAAR
jgi:asparagine synthase (glutamine-hydrolysing)